MAENRPITFYHAPQSRSIIVHWMLEELEVPYQMRAEITGYVDRLKQRPALKRVYAKDAELVAAGYASA